MSFKPFFINSNICTKADDISSYENFMTAISGNTGNSYITYSLIKELFGGLVDVRQIKNIYNYDFKKSSSDIDYINNEASSVFLILQDQIRIQESYGLKLPYKEIEEFISKLNKPVIIAGLGANSFNGYDSEFHKKLDPELIHFLKYLSDNCVEIGIRGHYTEEVLGKIGVNNVRVIGCPSFYETGRDRFIKKSDNINIESVILTSKLSPELNYMDNILQDYLGQSLVAPAGFNKFVEYPNKYDLETIYKKNGYIFSSIDDWKKLVSNYKFAIGFRLHGSILAINSGVPALCLNGDSRATEMCELLRIPHNPNIIIKNEKDILKCYENLDYSELNACYSKLYDNFKDFIYKNGLLLYEENPSVKDEVKYIKQPSLKLYRKTLYIKLFFLNIFSILKEKSHIVVSFFGIKMKFKKTK